MAAAATEWKQPSAEESLARAVQVCKEHGVLLPTYAQLANPELIPAAVKQELSTIGLWDVNPRNLFRISWHNEAKECGGGFGQVNFVEIPRQLTGIPVRILMLVGKWFPTGCHKVGASYGPLVERLVNGRFDPTTQKALWPSTGNYCRGGAFNSALLHSPAIAVLPAQMSKERFEWLGRIGAEVCATPGCESSVKAVFDKNNELVRNGHGRVVSLNQFSEFSNPLWHYNVTGPALEELFIKHAAAGQRLAGIHLTQGSAGTLSSAEYLRSKFPLIKVGAGEALQCPTLLHNGFGDHRIEGIGDKHVPWILNARNLDAAVAIDDNYVVRCMRLVNEPIGQQLLLEKGMTQAELDNFSLMGISSLANMIGCIKMAKFFEWGASEIALSVGTDSMAMYGSRLAELSKELGPYTRDNAVADLECIRGLSLDHVQELGHYERKRIHNLKYYTWIEQQGKTEEELRRQWFDPDYWIDQFGPKRREELDAKIIEFNRRTGLAQKYGM
jgi:cysteine synthase